MDFRVPIDVGDQLSLRASDSSGCFAGHRSDRPIDFVGWGFISEISRRLIYASSRQ
jgi:hypothetical protein